MITEGLWLLALRLYKTGASMTLFISAISLTRMKMQICCGVCRVQSNTYARGLFAKIVNDF